MAITTKTATGLQESCFFNHHRFDNSSAWLDQQVRNKRRVRGEPLGHGFAVPRTPAPARVEKPFTVQEYSMTSGLLLNRRYAQKDTDFKLDCIRSDPYHFPNHLQVEDEMHFEDRRARSQHIDPRCREKLELPRDKELRLAVPEEMVKNMIMANYKDMKVKPDPVVMAIQFDPNVRPQKETIKELNVDLSCCDLPARENFRERGNIYAATTNQTKGDWKWCLGGRRPITPPDHGDVKVHKSASLPGTLSGKSHLHHQKGAKPGPFHGSTFIPAEANQRMRGGTNAVEGFAGTFPVKGKASG